MNVYKQHRNNAYHLLFRWQENGKRLGTSRSTGITSDIELAEATRLQALQSVTKLMHEGLQPLEAINSLYPTEAYEEPIPTAEQPLATPPPTVVKVTPRLVKDKWLLRYRWVEDGKAREANRPANKKRVEKEAQQEQERVNALIQQGQKPLSAINREDFIPAADGTFATYHLRWLNDQKQALQMGNIQKTTYAGYEIASLKHIIPFFEHRGTALAEMTREDLQAFVAFLFNKGLKPKSIQGYMKPLQASCRRAYTDGLMARNPTSGIKLPMVAKGTAPTGAGCAAPEGTAPSHTLEDVQQLLNYTASSNWDCHALIFTAYYTGMRGEELLALRWSDVLWGDRAIKVHRVRVRTASGEVYEREGTKTSEGRLVPMGPKLMAVLTAERQRQQRNAALLGIEAGDYVFAQNDGTPWNPGSRREPFKTMQRKAGLTNIISLHGTRHTFRSLMHEGGMAECDIGMIGGWKQDGVMNRVYLHLSAGWIGRLGVEVERILGI